MTVITTKELPDKRSVTEDESGRRAYKQVWLVETNDKNDSGNIVLNAPGLPQYNSHYQTELEINLLSLVKGRSATQQGGSRTTWHANIDYTPLEPGEEEDEPVNRDPVIAVSFEVEQVIPETTSESLADDANGLKNSAGELFDPPTTIPQSRLIITITRNEAIFNSTQALSFIDSVNSAAFGGFAAKQIKMRSITSPGKQTEELADGTDVTFWPVTYTLAFKESWQLKLIDQGSYFWTGSSRGDGDRKPFEAKGKSFIGNLDGTGLALSESAAKPAFISFDVFKAKDFSNITPALPTNLN